MRGMLCAFGLQMPKNDIHVIRYNVSLPTRVDKKARKNIKECNQYKLTTIEQMTLQLSIM